METKYIYIVGLSGIVHTNYCATYTCGARYLAHSVCKNFCLDEERDDERAK